MPVIEIGKNLIEGAIPEGLNQVVRAITPAEIRLLHSTAVEILAAPPDGQINVPIQAIYKITYGVAAYTGGGNVQIRYTGNTDDALRLNATAIRGVTSAATETEVSSAWQQLSGAQRHVAAIEIHVAGNAAFAPATAEGVLTVTLRYKTIGVDLA